MKVEKTPQNMRLCKYAIIGSDVTFVGIVSSDERLGDGLDLILGRPFLQHHLHQIRQEVLKLALASEPTRSLQIARLVDVVMLPNLKEVH